LEESKQGESQQSESKNSKPTEERLDLSVSNTAGRLKFFWGKWREVTSDSRILNWIQDYVIPFSKRVQKSIPKETSWSEKERDIIRDHIDKLIIKGAISRCQPSKDQWLSKIFLVTKPDGTYKLILNLRKLNKFIETEHFKLEDCKVVIGYLKKLGFLSVIYLDDLLLLGNAYSECSANIKFSIELLQSLGFIINEEKSCRVPSQGCKFLGFILNSRTMTLELPLEKSKKCEIKSSSLKK